MRVLHVISSGGMYGAEAVVLNLLKEMQGGKDRGMLAVFDNRGYPQPDLYRHALDAGIESYAVPCRGQVDLGFVSRLRALATQVQPDVVHAHGYKADVYARFAGRKSPWAFVSTCHNWVENDLPTRVYGAVDRLALRGAAGVVAVSAQVRQQLLDAHVRTERIAVIRNGIREAPYESGLASRPHNLSRIERSPVIGFAGRLSYEKGCDLFLKVAQGILAELPSARFLVAGDGPERQTLEAAIDAQQLTHAISLLGRCDDMPAFFQSLDLLLSTSRTEGMPIGLMEAMSSGLAIVATSVGDVQALVDDQVTGLLRASGDIAGLVQATLSILHDPRQCIEYGRAGARRIADHFSARQMTRQYRAFYDRILHPGDAFA